MMDRSVTGAGSDGAIWHCVRFAAYSGFFFTLVFNAWSVGKFLSTDGRIVWPHTLHVWLVQGVVLACSTLGAVAFVYRARIKDTLRSLTPHAQAVVLLVSLVTIECLLGSAFWLTQAHPDFSDWGYLYLLFHLDREFNIPALYAAAQLWLAAAFAFICSSRTRAHAGAPAGAMAAWLAAGVILSLLGIDELLSVHERAASVLVAGGLLDPGYDKRLGGYGYAWTIVGIPVAVAFSAWFTWKFYEVFRCNRRRLLLLLIAGAAFFSGSILLENAQVYVTDSYQLERSPRVMILFEELLEMLGASVAIYVFFLQARELTRS